VKRICKYCGKTYDGDPGGSCCQACAAKQRATTLRPRKCKECSAVFLGGPRAWYCPTCREIRTKDANRRYKRKGARRKLGSTDYCIVCGNPYTVKSGRQKYCPECAPEAVRKIDNAQSREWNAKNTTPEKRKAERNESAAPINCLYCNKLFTPRGPALTCSQECSEALKKRNMSAWEAAHRKQRNEYRKQFNARHIGDIDVCVDCGKQYAVTNGRQKRCSECSKYRKEGKDL